MYTVVTASSDHKIKLNYDTVAQAWWKPQPEKSLFITLKLNQTKCTFIPHIQAHSATTTKIIDFHFTK